MRIVFLFQMLFFSLFLFGQTDSLIRIKPKIGAVYVSDYNVVYRGIRNPIDIVVPNAKSFTVSGIGVYHENGEYFISPGQGLETKVYLEVTLEDNTIVNEEHVFKIKNISSPIAKINYRNCHGCYVNMSLSEFKDAIISAHIENFEHRFSFEVLRFTIKVKKKPAIFVEGNSINEEVYNQLKRIKKQDLITISNIQYRVNPSDEGLWPSLPPLLIRISE